MPGDDSPAVCEKCGKFCWTLKEFQGHQKKCPKKDWLGSRYRKDDPLRPPPEKK